MAVKTDISPIKIDATRIHRNESGKCQYHAGTKHTVPEANSINAANCFIASF